MNLNLSQSQENEIKKTFKTLDDIMQKEVKETEMDDTPTRYECRIRFESESYEKLSNLLGYMLTISECDKDEKYGVFMALTGMWSQSYKIMRKFIDDYWGCLNDISPKDAVIKKTKSGKSTFTINDETYGGLPFRAITQYVSRNPDVNVTLHWADTWEFAFGYAKWIDGRLDTDVEFTRNHKYNSPEWKKCVDMFGLEMEWSGMWGNQGHLDFEELKDEDDYDSDDE